MIRKARVGVFALNLLIGYLRLDQAQAAADESARVPAPVLKVYVAASAKDVVDAIARQFKVETGIAVEVSPGSSSKLAKQIVEGAPADIFLSADAANADYLLEKKLVARRRDLLTNRLVVVVAADSKLTVASLADLGSDDVKQLAVAMEKVPAGEYARQALKKAAVWERVERKVVGGEDVRATLAFVENGASAGIVYATDVMGNSRVRVELEVDPTLHSPIVYPLIVVNRDPMTPGTMKFYDYMASPKGMEFFMQAGFKPPR